MFAKRAREKAPLVKGSNGINMLKLLLGVENAGELAVKPGKELESDETHLRRKGALKKLMEEVNVNPEPARQQIVDSTTQRSKFHAHSLSTAHAQLIRTNYQMPVEGRVPWVTASGDRETREKSPREQYMP